MAFIADRLSDIKPSPTIAVTTLAAELKKQGKDIIGLGAGEPDFDTYDNVKKAAIEAINQGMTKYTAVDGTVELKSAIVEKFKRENNLNYAINNISVGAGAKQVIYNAFIATLNPKDEVIIPAPYWVSYPDMVALAGGKSVIAETNDANNFKLTAALLEKKITARTKWVIINSPGNPTGAAYSKTELRELADILLQHDHVHILSDDIYEHIIYDNFKFHSLAEIEPKLFNRILTVNGVAKAYAMTGWRIGYAAGNVPLIKSMAIIQSQSTSNPCSISQAAAVEALNGDQSYLSERNKIFKRRRDLVVSMLNNIEGINCNIPNGAFYVFPSMKGLVGKTTIEGTIIKNDRDFCKYLLEKSLVAVVPGIAFGAENFFRISYATSDEILQKAVKRIAKTCKTFK